MGAWGPGKWVCRQTRGAGRGSRRRPPRPAGGGSSVTPCPLPAASPPTSPASGEVKLLIHMPPPGGFAADLPGERGGEDLPPAGRGRPLPGQRGGKPVYDARGGGLRRGGRVLCGARGGVEG